MATGNAFFTPARVKLFNLACLCIALVSVLFIPIKKDVWYDETVSVLCSKGLFLQDSVSIQKNETVTSADINQRNTARNVLSATIADNSNSILYNIALHWFTIAKGNSVYDYLLFSRICGAVTLIVFFALAMLVIGANPFTGISVLLLLFDMNFWGMSHEIRTYELAMIFSAGTGLYFFKYCFEKESFQNLLLTGLFAAGALLSHYLSICLIATLFFFILFFKGKQLFTLKTILAILIPVALVGIYLAIAINGLRTMNNQSHQIEKDQITTIYSPLTAIIQSLRFCAFNFKISLPAIFPGSLSIVVSATLLASIWVLAFKRSQNTQQRRNLTILIVTGLSYSVFLLALSLKAGHYKPLYSRYFTFGVPFAVLATGYIFSVLYSSSIPRLLIGTIVGIFFIPTAYIWIRSLKTPPDFYYSHPPAAQKIIENNATEVTVNSVYDAFLINSFLPSTQNVTYRIQRDSRDIIIQSPHSPTVSMPNTKVDKP